MPAEAMQIVHDSFPLIWILYWVSVGLESIWALPYEIYKVFIRVTYDLSRIKKLLLLILA